jgi:hypothetical protein
MEKNTDISRIKNSIEKHKVISIIGISKNAGKTTVMNKIIDIYKKRAICITSIGLDGEKVDNITNKDKPRIKVYPGMLVLTAIKSLKETTAKYRVLELTSIRSALGKIVLIEITEPGLVLLAGPTSKNSIKKSLQMIQKYNPFITLIDGALFRKSIASADVSDAVIFVTGASYSENMNVIVNDTKHMVDQLMKKNMKLPKKFTEKMDENVISYDENNKCFQSYNDSLIFNENNIAPLISGGNILLYLPGALTDRLTDVILKNRNQFNKLNIIIKDSSFLLISPENWEKLKIIGVKVNVLNPIEILFVAYNPTSPYFYEFDNLEFKSKLREKLNILLVNVMKDLE